MSGMQSFLRIESQCREARTACVCGKRCHQQFNVAYLYSLCLLSYIDTHIKIINDTLKTHTVLQNSSNINTATQMTVSAIRERERERQRQRQTDRDRDRQTETETERQRQTQTQTDKIDRQRGGKRTGMRSSLHISLRAMWPLQWKGKEEEEKRQ